MTTNETSNTENKDCEKTTLFARPNGPLIISGKDVKLVDENGNEIKSADRFSICRCGQTANQPYCDGSHNRINFQG